MKWNYPLSTIVWIFPVGRGNAAFLRSGLNQGFILDMAGGNRVDPATFIKEHFVPWLDRFPENNGHKIAQAVLSHPHSDHIAQCKELETGELHPALLTCPHDKTKEGLPNEMLNWKRIINRPGTEGVVDEYKNLYEHRELPLQTIHFESKRSIPNLCYGIYYVRPPLCEQLHPSNDNDYGNATSIMFYFRHGNHSILFPGDITPKGMKRILDDKLGIEKRFTYFDPKYSQPKHEWHTKTNNQPALKRLLQDYGLSVLLAPHHGLESCYSQELYDAMKGGKPNLVIISERRDKSERDGKEDWHYGSSNGAFGLAVEINGKIEMKKRLSTINGHHIVIIFSGTGKPVVYAHTEPEYLLGRILS